MLYRTIWVRTLFFSLCIFVFVGCTSDPDLDGSSQVIAETGQDQESGEFHQSSAPTDSSIVNDWCAEHEVPESACTRCHPDLIEQFKTTGDWCGPHDLPESHCRLCNPGIVFPLEELKRASAIELAGEEISVSLNYRTNADACATDGALIQFGSSNTAERSGITVQAVRGSQRETIDEAPAEIRFDETNVSAVTTSVSALVTKWLTSPGDQVTKDQPLAILQSPEIASLRSTLVTSYARYQVEQKELDRYSKLKESNLISDADWAMQSAVTEQARAEYVGTRGLLFAAGLVEADVQENLEFGNITNRFLLRAPADGVIIERTGMVGEQLDAGRAYATVGDPYAMWIEAQLTERQMHEVALGHQLVFSSDGGGINRVGGKIVWISRFLDQHTRTGTVRAHIVDPNHTLRAGEFGHVQIVHSEGGNIALVPKDAVQWEGCCNVVFVQEAIDRYRPSKVRLLGSTGPFYQVDDGVYPGQDVVVEGSFLLKTELKKSSIGAGCCGLEPVG